ncbi:SixA phosphatase family protein [Aporhodopirellula aestuarii]|uniref:Histidine phosphatase family protein n=1 Tax=Aporhodopirellula aestuarii TaxID=2950107 RepID=A0ABT0U8A7_9BACT|nr:histidine phosphatase family protein [Aporhodopirellula aestuarii]MCM2373204.1 histidine phosphatase family protein [Aporhodopirellula aestuarii]
MRHAKSDWSEANLADHDRPLNARGLRDAPAMARWISESGFLPDCILCSSAKRTQQTAELMLSYWNHTGCETPTLLIKPELYLAGADRIFSTVRHSCGASGEDCANVSRAVLVLGHNPGISHAASMLSGDAVGLPTAAVAVLRCEAADWSMPLDFENSRRVAEMRPKSLDRDIH